MKCSYLDNNAMRLSLSRTIVYDRIQMNTVKKLAVQNRAKNQNKSEGPTAVLAFRVSKEVYRWLDEVAKTEKNERMTPHTRQTFARDLLTAAIEQFKQRKKK